jgi:hypothetical protein
MRGNLHCHTKEHSACGSVPLRRLLKAYSKAGHAFLAVTDHDHVTDLTDASARYPGMAFLHGFEYSSAENVLFIGERVPPLHRLPRSEAMAGADGLLTVICHPRPKPSTEYWTVEMIRGLRPAPIGMEVYNGHYSFYSTVWGKTNPLYTDIWDRLLSLGMKVWGFANDDFHDPRDFGRASNVALVSAPGAAGVLSALKAGRFYATSGLLLKGVSLGDGVISVTLASEAAGRFVGPGGRVLRENSGIGFSYAYSGEAYVRFEAESPIGRIFLQPFFPRKQPPA